MGFFDIFKKKKIDTFDDEDEELETQGGKKPLSLRLQLRDRLN